MEKKMETSAQNTAIEDNNQYLARSSVQSIDTGSVLSKRYNGTTRSPHSKLSRTPEVSLESPSATFNRQSSGVSAQGVPSWLSSTSPQATSNVEVRALQDQIDEISMQKETVEKYLKMEIDSLKAKLSHESMHDKEVHIASINNACAHHDGLIAQLRAQVSALSQENFRLKEESNVEHIMHQKEITQLREKHSSDMEAGNARMKEEIEILERHHNDIISTLKKMHNEELMSVKQRSKDGIALEQLANQIRASGGTLKLIEEQMNLRYKSLDSVREGQFEARERLVNQLEETARTRLETTESEEYRLKGLLIHMDQVVANLRGQGSEERERMKLEHQRLEGMQISLESERKIIYQRLAEETAEIRQRAAQQQEEYSRNIRSIRDQQVELMEAKDKLEQERKEFALYVTSNVKSAEASVKKLKDEEAALIRLKEDTAKEVMNLEQQRAAVRNQYTIDRGVVCCTDIATKAAHDIRNAENIRASIDAAYQEVSKEKSEVLAALRELQIVSEKVNAQDVEIEEKKRQLQIDTATLTNSLTILQRKEQEVISLSRHKESQLEHLRNMEDEITNKKVTLALQRKEIAQQQLISTRTLSVYNDSESNYYTRPGSDLNMARSSRPSAPEHKHLYQRNHEQSRYESPAPLSNVNKAEYHNYNTSKQDPLSGLAGFEDELALAKKAMMVAKGGISKAVHTSSSTNKFIQSEKEFLTRIKINGGY